MSELETEPLEDGEAPPADPDRPHVCPECGETFKLAMTMGAHRAKVHGVPGSSKTTKYTRRGRPPGSRNKERTSSPHESRRKAIRETLIEFVDFADELGGRSDQKPKDIRDVIRRDADKLGDSIAYLADRFNPLGLVVDATMGHGGVISMARGFMGVGTWIVAHWQQLLRSRKPEVAVCPNCSNETYLLPDGPCQACGFVMQAPEPESVSAYS